MFAVINSDAWRHFADMGALSVFMVVAGYVIGRIIEDLL